MTSLFYQTCSNMLNLILRYEVKNSFFILFQMLFVCIMAFGIEDFPNNMVYMYVVGFRFHLLPLMKYICVRK
jgi:hypothetical protein